MTPDVPADPVAAARAQADAALAALKTAQAEAEAAVRRAEEAAARASADAAAAATGTPARGSAGPLDPAQVAAIRAGYAFAGPALELGALVNGDPLPDVPVRIPLAMVNRHGLVAGATGTGKTRTLQLLAEQLSAQGVPVFAPDVKGDLSGLATPGAGGARLTERTAGVGQRWEPAAFPTEFFSLGGQGRGIPIRATVAGFGPLLLAKALDLNETQESSLGLVFHWAEREGLPMLDLQDLRAVLAYLTSADGKAELEGLGGLSKATAGVILRKLLTFADEGADAFFGEPELDTAELLRTAPDGRGVLSLLELPGVQDQPRLYSTFLMWLLADLYNDLPEVGDLDRPELVFFFDEAHLLFADASKEFLAAVVQTVRLIRSKGVGVFFVTQTPKDVPGDVLAQLGSRIQHQLRAFTPDDAKALRASASTYPMSGYDLEEVLTVLGTGEAIVTVMSERGAPSPVAWTRLRAPQASMSPTSDEKIDELVAASPLLPRYGTALDRDSARELLAAQLDAARREADAERARADAERARADAERARAQADEELRRQQREIEEQAAREERRSRRPAPTPRRPAERSPLEEVLRSPVTTRILTEVVTGIFGTRRRRR